MDVGHYQSYCILCRNEEEETSRRLEILNKSNDGFFIASEDLKLRGPGDLFGIRQSGILDFKLGDVFQDAKILQRASEAAEQLISEDENLEKQNHQNIREYLQKYIREGMLKQRFKSHDRICTKKKLFLV